ncbi:uncharacterized protein LOC107980639 [Nasonia vitripennis]|uniref:Uncharacterized protein n=1 Tax=Nasonia vitripennis TaxID=7425 RepID=A0A7M7IN13_NASVI|nr:uncharacterized protein LOC107980639 [Nasonia vitripennis]
MSTMKIIQDDNLKALLILIDLLPTSNACIRGGKGGKGGKVKSSKNLRKEPVKITPQKCMLEFVSSIESIQNFSEEKRLRMGTPVQPYIVAIDGRTTQFQVQGDGCIIARKPSNEIITTFHLLFKMYYVFNLTYPILLQNFYLFMQVNVYGIQDKCPESVSSLYTALKFCRRSG